MPVRSVDLMPLSRAAALLPDRARAVIEARLARGHVPWTKTAAWSKGLQRHLLRQGVLDGRTPLLVVQSLPALALDDVRYVVYTDRVGREGAAVGGRHASRFTTGWLERETAFLRGASRVFVMGPSTRQVLVNEYSCDPDRVVVVGAGANMALGPAHHRTAGRRLVFVGTQWELKGGQTLLEAFAAVRATRPELELSLVGSAPAGPLPPGVRALGRLPHEAMDDVYDQADLLVIPTHMEAFGIALVEGLMKGLPCVCSTVGNQPWIVADAGEAVAPGSVDELAGALHRVLDDYPAYQERAHRRGDELRESMRWPTVAQRICDEFLKERAA
jgi:glycosyltransferase involved in cell wall biosynthesis